MSAWRSIIRCHQPLCRRFLRRFIEEADEWRNSATPILVGMSQWPPGMSMVGDMFNTQLKSKLDALCTEIVAHLTASEAVVVTSAPSRMT